MRLAELQVALRAADSGAVLVPPRILEQIIQEARNLRGSVWSPPHKHCYVVDRQTLFRHIEQTYLDLEPDQLLPATVILLARPPSEELSDVESKHVLLKYWRLLFHASVHRGPGFPSARTAADRLPPHRCQRNWSKKSAGPSSTRFARFSCRTGICVPNADDREVYIEFAAVYLEKSVFLRIRCSESLFPGLKDLKRIERMLAEDVDAEALFHRTRLKDAPNPVVAIDPGSEESESLEQYWNLVRSAERANLAKNNVRAAILRTRAWRIAPAAHGQQTRDEALADMRRLAARLATALRLTPAEAEEWGRDLLLLLDKADQGRHPAEGAICCSTCNASAPTANAISSRSIRSSGSCRRVNARSAGRSPASARFASRTEISAAYMRHIWRSSACTNAIAGILPFWFRLPYPRPRMRFAISLAAC